MPEVDDPTKGNENDPSAGTAPTTPPNQPSLPSAAAHAKTAETNGPVYISLEAFAQAHARTRYGIELMAGFYHEQETSKHFADTEENWHALIKAYANKEVK